MIEIYEAEGKGNEKIIALPSAIDLAFVLDNLKSHVVSG